MMASAMVCSSPMAACQDATGSWEAMIMARVAWRSSMISNGSGACWGEGGLRARSSMTNRPVRAIPSPRRAYRLPWRAPVSRTAWGSARTARCRLSMAIGIFHHACSPACLPAPRVEAEPSKNGVVLHQRTKGIHGQAWPWRGRGSTRARQKGLGDHRHRQPRWP